MLCGYGGDSGGWGDAPVRPLLKTIRYHLEGIKTKATQSGEICLRIIIMFVSSLSIGYICICDPVYILQLCQQFRIMNYIMGRDITAHKVLFIILIAPLFSRHTIYANPAAFFSQISMHIYNISNYRARLKLSISCLWGFLQYLPNFTN